MAKRDPVATGVLIALAVIGLLLFMWFLSRIGSIVIIVLLAIVLAAGIAPLVDRLTQARFPPKGWHLPRGVSILLIYLGLTIVVLGLIGLVGSVVVREAIQLAQDAPRYYAIARDAFVGLQREYTFLPDLAEVVDRLRSQIGQISSYVYSALGRLVGFASNLLVIIVVFVLAYYILVDREGIKRGLLRLIPPSRRETYGDTFSEMGMRIGGWLRGELLLTLIVGTAISLFLLAIGVPYAFIIGLIGAVAELLPLVGPWVAAVPAILLVLFQPAWQIIAVVAFFIVLSQVEGNYLVPKIMKQQVGLSPLITIIALLVGGTLAGAIGALLSIPLAAAAQVFVRRIIVPAVEKAEEGE